MMLAHGGEVLLGPYLLILWLIAEVYAIAVGVDASFKVIRARSSRWQPLWLGIFPFLFGGVSLLWLSTDYRYDDVRWPQALAAVPFICGLVAILGSFKRHKT